MIVGAVIIFTTIVYFLVFLWNDNKISISHRVNERRENATNRSNLGAIDISETSEFSPSMYMTEFPLVRMQSIPIKHSFDSWSAELSGELFTIHNKKYAPTTQAAPADAQPDNNVISFSSKKTLRKGDYDYSLSEHRTIN